MRSPRSLGWGRGAGVCWKGITGLPGFLGSHKAFLLGLLRSKTRPQPWNQKSVERLEPGLARRRATQSVFHDKGRGWVDNPRQRSPLVQSPSYFCATPEEGDEKQASDLRELAPSPASHGVGIETRPRGRTGEITCLC